MFDPFHSNQPRPPANTAELLVANIGGGLLAFLLTPTLHEASAVWLAAYTAAHYSDFLSSVTVFLAWPAYAVATFALGRLGILELIWQIKRRSRR
jgi:hypothetical protein